MKRVQINLALLVFVTILTVQQVAEAQVIVSKDFVGGGSGMAASGSIYTISAVGQPVIGITSGASYAISAGVMSSVSNESIPGAPALTSTLTIFGTVVKEPGQGDFHTPADGGLQVTLKNMSTGVALNTMPYLSNRSPDGVVNVMFEIAQKHWTKAGDTLEITIQTSSPDLQAQSVRHIVTADELNRGKIFLEELIVHEIPAKTELLRNYPNPFNPETWIPYRLAEDAEVTLTIYNVDGTVVRTIKVGHQPPAVYESKAKAIHWDGRSDSGERVASDVYFYHLRAGDYHATKKMVILK